MLKAKVKKNKFEQNRLFDFNGQLFARVYPELAMEIGFNESLLLLQLDFLIAISDHERDGQRWTYQSVTDIQKMFPFWSRATINRVINSLEKKSLIQVGNFNRKKYDRTRWFAINADEARKLKSIEVKAGDSSSAHYDSKETQFGTDCAQKVTTIPKITTENTTDKKNSDKDHALLKNQPQPKPSASIEQHCLETNNLEMLGSLTGSSPPLEPSLMPLANLATVASKVPARLLLTDTERGPVKRIFDFHSKATGAKRAKLTDETRIAVASRISSKSSLNPSGYKEDDIKLAILGCLASRDSRDAFFFNEDSKYNYFESQDESGDDESIYLAKHREKEPEGFRWKTDLKHICAFADRVAKFLDIAKLEGYTVADVRKIEQEEKDIAA